MSGPRGYSSYHGRKVIWKVLVAVLLILVILAAVGFLLLQKYLVYDESGTPHLQLPEKPTSSAVSSSDAGSTGAESDEPLNITIDEPERKDIQAIQLGADPAAWASATSGQNAFCVSVKTAGGRVQYQTSFANAPLSDTAGAASAALPGLLAADSYAIARLSCLQDSASARANVDTMGLKNTGGYIFYDGNNENWLDPSKPATVSYLCAIAKECADMGFDEILLTDLSYPTYGKLSAIDYNGADQAQALADLVSAVKTAVGEGVLVSVELPDAVITSGADETAGQSLAALAPLADRVYAACTAAQSAALEQVVAAVSDKTAFVPELTGETMTSGSYLRLS